MNLEITNRYIYVVSDIHNDASGFKELLDKIAFSKDDLLIINGDIFDRGDEPVDLYFEILKHSNIQVVQGNHDVWLAREILEKYENRKVGMYISYNSLPILEERLVPVDLVNLANWIREQPYYINLDLNGTKYQIAHAETYDTPERIWETTYIMMTLFADWRSMRTLFPLSDIRQQRIEEYGDHHPEGQYVQTAEMDTNLITAKGI